MLHSNQSHRRTRVARAGVGLFLLGIALTSFTATASEQKAFMRWDSSCVHLTEQSYADAPMKDGQPDYSQVKLHGLKLDKACATIQVRKAQ